MSQFSLIQKLNINNKSNDINNENIDFENDFINSNLSFDNNFENKDKLLIKDFIDDKNEDNLEIKTILSDLDKNININIKEKENKNFKECQEILNILKKPLSDKNIRFYNSPFKPLLKPRKISMVGRVFYDIPNDENNTNSVTTQNSSNSN
jgi:hypothetical protein